MKALKKECDDVVDEYIKGNFDVFQNACDQFEALCPSIQIPKQWMSPQKKVVNRDIVNDHEDDGEKGESGDKAE